jgi:hypothetical protein
MSARSLTGDAAAGPLRKLLEEKPALDVVRRVEQILERIEARSLTDDQVRELRAAEALERAGTPEARKVLEKLAKGADSPLTTDARASLARLAKR